MTLWVGSRDRRVPILSGLWRRRGCAISSGSVLAAQQALLGFGDEFDLESVTILHVRRVVIGPSCMRMLVAEEQAPSVVGGGLGDAVDVSASSTEECKVVETAQRPFVRSGSIWRLLDHDVRVGELPASYVCHSWNGK